MIGFIISSILLGVGLAMDAFSVSLANGLNEPRMRKRRQVLIAGMFGFFQALMPMTGWFCVHTIITYMKAFEKAIPWIALVILCWIGIKMIRERKTAGHETAAKLTFAALLLQAVATSIDALSAGFAIAEYHWMKAIACALIIAAVTFIISMGGLLLGRTFGTKLAGKANVLGGVILILIGVEIFVRGVFL